MVSHPTRSLFTDPFWICVSGLVPAETLQLHLQAIDGSLICWSATATFLADSSGNVDTSRMAPTVGTYGGIDELGLFWSMKPDSKLHSAQPFVLPENGVVRYFLTSTPLQSFGTEKSEFCRFFCPPDLVQETISAGNQRGVIFRPQSGVKGGVLVITGSGGGINETAAKAFAALGYAAYALAHFSYPDRPKSLLRMPLEYFGSAVQFLRSQSFMSGKKVFVAGSSRGGEAALLIGSYFSSAVDGIIAQTPSSVTYSGIVHEEDSHGGEPFPAWTWEGKPLPIAPYDGASEMDLLDPSAPRSIRRYFEAGRRLDPEAYSRAAIPVERIICKVLLTCGDADGMWPADQYCREIIERAAVHGTSHLFRLIEHAGAGHLIKLPGLPVQSGSAGHSVLKTSYDYGGTVAGNGRAAAKHWRELREFLDRLVGTAGQ